MRTAAAAQRDLMKVLIANDGVSDVGGVQAYLDAVIGALECRGHALAVAYCTDSGGAEVSASTRRLPRFQLAGAGRADAIADVRRWAPDVCFSHNMHDLAVDRSLGATAPVVKFMHGYFGTCIGGQKMKAFPGPSVCDRVFGPACAALYLPRRCGQLSPAPLVLGWRWARSQRSLFGTYAAIVVASDYMKREYVRNGCDARGVYVNPLFPTNIPDRDPAPGPPEPHVAFLGRMTKLKGGDLLIRAVRHAADRLSRPIELTMIGDGPQRREWEALASRLNVAATFTGWLSGGDRWRPLRRASLIALPSLWPEPFGLVGLEAGALGVPAVAIAAGGVGQWLRDGVNGVAVPSPATERSLGDALASVLADREKLASLRLGAHRVAEQMTLGDHTDRLERIFKNLDSRSPINGRLSTKD
jgi:glycosyltransferase involved in cell wall biosynthesis